MLVTGTLLSSTMPGNLSADSTKALAWFFKHLDGRETNVDDSDVCEVAHRACEDVRRLMTKASATIGY